MEADLKKQVIQLSEDLKKNSLPSVSVDCVVFGFHHSNLKVLLTRLKNDNNWMLPGGYVLKNEHLNDSANRILEERTGAKNIFLTQFKTFGNLLRSEEIFDMYPDNLWHKQRFISVAYYALTDYNNVIPVITNNFSAECEWKDINDLPSFAMDHKTILDEALLQLRRDLNYKPIGANLLPEKFTMPELQKLYEVILGKELNRGNFYRKMKRYGILKKLNETRKGGAHKSPDLYSFETTAYEDALQTGFKENW